MGGEKSLRSSAHSQEKISAMSSLGLLATPNSHLVRWRSWWDFDTQPEITKNTYQKGRYFSWWLCIPKLEPILARSANEAPAPARASTRCAPPENPSLELSNEFPPPIFYFLAERAGFSGGSPTASGGGGVARSGKIVIPSLIKVTLTDTAIDTIDQLW